MDLSKTVKVETVTIRGNNRTKPSFFDVELRHLLGGESIDLRQAAGRLHEAVQSMERHGIFQGVNLNLNIKSIQDGKYLADIEVAVEEKGVPYLKLESYVKGSAVGGELQAALRSPFGYGETLKISLGGVDSTLQQSEKFLSLFVPHFIPGKATLQTTVKHAVDDSSYFLSYKQSVESILLESTSLDGRHKVDVEIAKRDEVPVPVLHGPSSTIRAAGKEVLQSASPSSKVSAKYSFTALDTRDSSASPTRGSLLKGGVELATPLGSAQFIKGELTAQTHRTLGAPIHNQPGLVASLSTTAAAVVPWRLIHSWIYNSPVSNTTTTVTPTSNDFIHLSDRLHLGGPLNLRGFDLYGVGSRSVSQHPRSPSSASTTSSVLPAPFTQGLLASPAGASIGGESKMTTSAILSVPLPFAEAAQAGGRAFLFASAGVLNPVGTLSSTLRRSSHNTSTTSSSSNNNLPPAASLLSSMRVSVGAGLSMVLGPSVRIELTYSLPVLRSPSDSVKPFQIGVGLSIN